MASRSSWTTSTAPLAGHFKDPGEYAYSSGWHRRNWIFVVLGMILNRWSHSGHNLVTGTSRSDVSTGGSVSSDQSSQLVPSSTVSSTGSSPGNLQHNTNCACALCSASQCSSIDGSSGSSTLAASYAWIHICVETYAGRMRLKAVDIRGCLTDGPMFTKINGTYYQAGSLHSMRRIFSLRVLASVELVHVRLRAL